MSDQVRTDEPLGAFPPALAVGQYTTLADFYWLGLVSYVGDPAQIRDNWPNLPRRLELVLSADPDFEYAYQAGGLLLMSSAQHGAADEVLSQAVERYPDRWIFPFYAGFNAWQGFGDIDRAGKLLLKAAAIVDSPPMLSKIANRLLVSGDRLDQAIQLVEALLADPQPPLLYERFSSELAALRLERDLRQLERARDNFRRLRGRLPAELHELLRDFPELYSVAARINAFYDNSSGVFRSPLLPKRLELPSLDGGSSLNKPKAGLE